MTIYQMNKPYHIVLSPHYWPTSFSIDILITGICTIESISEIDKSGKVDIFTDYFEKYRLSEEVYQSFIKDNTVIYIGKPILSTNPIEIEENESKRIFIPFSIIDSSQSYQYEECKRFTFSIQTGIKRFESFEDENDYIQQVKKTINEALGKYQLFIGENLSIDYSSKNIYSTKIFCDKKEAIKEQTFNEYKKREEEQSRLQEIREYEIARKVVEMDTARLNYEEKYNEFTNYCREAKKRVEVNNEVAVKLEKIKKRLSYFIKQLKNKEIDVDQIETFEQLWQKV